MAPKQNPSQSIKIGNGQVSNLQLGGQAGGDLNVTQSQQINQGSATQEISSSEVADLLGQLNQLVLNSNLPENQKSKAIRNVETAQDEVQSEKPDKEFAANSLKRAIKILKETEETVEVGSKLWEKTQPILSKLLPWFGVALSFFA
jgi:DNA-directed RNA polymerase specialized sigma subunit